MNPNEHLQHYLREQVKSYCSILVDKANDLEGLWASQTFEENLEKIEELLEVAKGFESIAGILATSGSLALDEVRFKMKQ